jgi:hypothetical protein
MQVIEKTANRFGNYIRDGTKLSGQQDLKEEAVNYFKHLGTTTGIINKDQTSVANLYPSMVSEEDALVDGKTLHYGRPS